MAQAIVMMFQWNDRLDSSSILYVETKRPRGKIDLLVREKSPVLE